MSDTDPTVHEMLTAYIGQARWFGGKGRGMRVVDVRRLGWLTPTETPTPATDSADVPRARVELAHVAYDDGEHELYQVPLSYYPHPQERLDHALVGSWEDPELGQTYAYDAMHDRHATGLWLAAFGRAHADEDLVFHRAEGFDLDLEAPSSLFSGEQSNSSVRFGEDSLMKVFRKVTPGRNPDIEIHDALTRAHNEHVPALYGWLEVPGKDGEEPLQLAMLQQFLRTASDGWELALASVRDLFAEGDLHADEVGGDFAGESHRLGVATAQVHDALREQFPTEAWGADELTTLGAAMKQRLEDALDVVPQLADHAPALHAAFDAVAGLDDAVEAQRIHADFHLGQTLRTVRGWKIVDFEGEPAKPLAERTRPDSAWRDVAGMLRSFDYAAHAVENDVEVDEEGSAQIAYRAEEWAERNRTAFLDGYVETSGRTPDTGLTDNQVTLLRAYEVDKAVYEAVYEARNRPGWLGIPLAGIARLTKQQSDAPDPDATEASDR